MNSVRNVLFLVEGESGEGKILKALNKIFDHNQAYHIVPYRTAIYELYDG